MEHEGFQSPEQIEVTTETINQPVYWFFSPFSSVWGFIDSLTELTEREDNELISQSTEISSAAILIINHYFKEKLQKIIGSIFLNANIIRFFLFCCTFRLNVFGFLTVCRAKQNILKHHHQLCTLGHFSQFADSETTKQLSDWLIAGENNHLFQPY